MQIFVFVLNYLVLTRFSGGFHENKAGVWAKLRNKPKQESMDKEEERQYFRVK
jgi:hypothetical protein